MSARGWNQSAYARRQARLAELIRARFDDGDVSTFELPAAAVLQVDGVDGKLPGEEVTIGVPEELIREAGWIEQSAADQDRDNYGAERAEEAYREASESILSELESTVDDIVQAALRGTLEDQVSSTDLILHGPVVAAVRAVLAAALEAAPQN